MKPAKKSSAVENNEDLVRAITRIAYGSKDGPTGLEMLSMSLAGNGLHYPTGPQLARIAAALEELARQAERYVDHKIED